MECTRRSVSPIQKNFTAWFSHSSLTMTKISYKGASLRYFFPIFIFTALTESIQLFMTAGTNYIGFKIIFKVTQEFLSSIKCAWHDFTKLM